MGSLEVNDELVASTIVDDEDTDGTRRFTEGIVDLLGKTALGDDLDSALDLTTVGDGDEGVALTGADDPVLLEGWGNHAVENDRWGWVGDNARLLNQGMSEEVNTEVSVLASLGRGGDADDLGWTLLEDDQVTNTDVVAWDGEVGAGGDSWWGWLWLGGNDLLLDGDVNVREGVGLLGLRVVGLRDVGLGGLNWVEELIDLAAEVLSVVVVAGGVFRHLGGFGSLLALLLFLGFFLFLLLDDDDFWWAVAVFWGLTGLARSLDGSGLLWLRERNVNVYLLNVSWVGDVDAWGDWWAVREVLRGSGGLGVVRRFGVD